MFSYAAGGMAAPEFPGGLEWINSNPLTMAELRGKVVLVDIWDYTCVNCIRTIPYLSEWYKRYAKLDLVIIGVHTPEFSFAKEYANVSAAVKRSGITYPVVLDNEYEVWNLYANQYWPRKYIIDANGYIVYDHAGEGDYFQTERLLQQYLKRIHPHAEFPDTYKHPGQPESGALCYPVTPELYLGYERGRMGNTEGYEPELSVKYEDKGEYMDGYIYAHGVWLNLPQSLKHERTDKFHKDYLAVKYHALSVNAVIKSADGNPCRIYVKQDDEYLTADTKCPDVQIDTDGRSFAEIIEPRMYRLVRNQHFSAHVIKIYSESKSLAIYSLTFGSCEVAKVAK